MAALRAKRRRLTKELEALEAATGSAALTFGRQRHARTRLVTIRLVDERLAAEGRSFDHREVVRLAAAADLKHAEVLVWPGGLRVVFSEVTVAIPPDAAASSATSSADGGDDPSASVASAVSRLKAELSELHGQQMGFFLALLDARLGFESATGASVQRQAEREHQHHQVPLPLSAPRSGLRNVTASFAYAGGSTATEDGTSPDGGEVNGEASPEAWSAYAATPGGAVSGSVYSALARIFRESAEEGQVAQAERRDERRDEEWHVAQAELVEEQQEHQHALGEEHEHELPLRDRLRSVYA